MRFFQWAQAGVLAALATETAALPGSGLQGMTIKPYKRDALQSIVTWDQHSLFVHGERIMFYSGEFHPFRLPVPGLWLDVFQKIRAMGYTGVSFYLNWALLEGTPGIFRDEGVFSFDPFFEAATQAGIYLLARPGPYINAEVSGGGFPGWLQSVPGNFRTLDPAYLEATQLYASSVGKIIADNQITNGGPIIMMQPENEYYDCASFITPCPNSTYMAYVENQFREAGVVVPYIVNDDNDGNFAPGHPAAVDIYGIDSYPLGFDCGTPEVWPNNALQTDLTSTHLQNSPTTPFSIVEFQGGSFDPWGGWGWAKCLELVGAPFERVFFKNNFATDIMFFSIYMTYGGSNWGNLGQPGGYSSYDYAAAIAEDLTVTREKYSEAKLLATFIQSSEAYLTATAGNLTTGTYTTSTQLATTPLFGNGSDTNFYIVRHNNYSSFATTKYKLTLDTSAGKLEIPQLGGKLSLIGRDSKIHVTDYNLGSNNLLYSSAEIFTARQYGNRTVLLVYGGPGEHHELAIQQAGKATVTEGPSIKTKDVNGTTVLNWKVGSTRTVVQTASGVSVYLLPREEAYNYWVLKLPNERGLFAPSLNASTVIVNAGYLMRNATVSGSTLNLVGDFNATTVVEVIGGAPSPLSTLNVNGQSTKFTQDQYGVANTTVAFNVPNFTIPSLEGLEWKYINTLPEIEDAYDDSLWPNADHPYTNDSYVTLVTPTSLVGSDYGFVTSNLLFRGHFTANGKEKTFNIGTWGGSAYGMSAWINSSFIGSLHGNAATQNTNNTFTVPKLVKGKNYVVTVLLDQTGLAENYEIGLNQMKQPRGILNYEMAPHKDTDFTWKITGNLGGFNYSDLVRGPLNEGGLWAERHGYHLPGAPISSWASSGGPTEGITTAGVAWYAANFDLDLPSGWQIPLSINFKNVSDASAPGGTAPAFRTLMFVNGYQFGEYINDIGPQTSFPVPEGIWNYHGNNYIAMSLWSLESTGAKVGGLELIANGTILSGYGDVPMSPMSSYEPRPGVY